MTSSYKGVQGFYTYLLYTRRLAREEDLLVIPLHTYLDKHIQYILIDIL